MPPPGAPDPRGALRAATMEVRVGRLRGPAVPVWDVLASGYVSAATREQLLAEFGAGTLGLPALTRRLTTIIEGAEPPGSGSPGPRGRARGPTRDPPPARTPRTPPGPCRSRPCAPPPWRCVQVPGKESRNHGISRADGVLYNSRRRRTFVDFSVFRSQHRAFACHGYQDVFRAHFPHLFRIRNNFFPGLQSDSEDLSELMIVGFYEKRVIRQNARQ